MRILGGIFYSQLHVQGRLTHVVAIRSHKCLHKRASQIFTQYVHIRKHSLKLNFHRAVCVGKGMEPNHFIWEALCTIIFTFVEFIGSPTVLCFGSASQLEFRCHSSHSMLLYSVSPLKLMSEVYAAYLHASLYLHLFSTHGC